MANARKDRQHSPPPVVNSPRRFPALLVAMAVIYCVWLTWLAFVAWVNIQAGNQ